MFIITRHRQVHLREIKEMMPLSVCILKSLIILYQEYPCDLKVRQSLNKFPAEQVI